MRIAKSELVENPLHKKMIAELEEYNSFLKAYCNSNPSNPLDNKKENNLVGAGNFISIVTYLELKRYAEEELRKENGLGLDKEDMENIELD